MLRTAINIIHIGELINTMEHLRESINLLEQWHWPHNVRPASRPYFGGEMSYQMAPFYGGNMIRTAFWCCHFNFLSHLKPHNVMP